MFLDFVGDVDIRSCSVEIGWEDGELVKEVVFVIVDCGVVVFCVVEGDSGA